MKKNISELRKELQEIGLDEAEQKAVIKLVNQVETDEDPTVLSQLDDKLIELKVSHPTISKLISNISQLLSGSGI